MSRALFALAAVMLLLTTAMSAASATSLFSCTLRSDDVASMRIDETGDTIHAEIEEPGRQLSTVVGQGRTAFAFSHTAGPRGYSVVSHFATADAQFELHYMDAPREMNADTNYASIQAWIVITPMIGEVREYDCDEIRIDVQAMQAAMGCDLSNRYGASACHPLFPAWRERDDLQFDGL